MKKQILILILIFMGLNTHAQLEKGKHVLGVQLPLIVNDMYSTRFAFTTSYGNTDYGISINPTYAYVVEHNWLIGVHATLGAETLKYNNNSGFPRTESYTDLGIAPFTRYYIDISKNGAFKIFGTAAIEFNTENSKFTYNNSSNPNYGPSGSSTSGSLGGGIAWFGKKISLDASMSNTALRIGIYRVFSGGKK